MKSGRSESLCDDPVRDHTHQDDRAAEATAKAGRDADLASQLGAEAELTKNVDDRPAELLGRPPEGLAETEAEEGVESLFWCEIERRKLDEMYRQLWIDPARFRELRNPNRERPLAIGHDRRVPTDQRRIVVIYRIEFSPDEHDPARRTRIRIVRTVDGEELDNLIVPGGWQYLNPWE
jgi:hypothetical protein